MKLRLWLLDLILIRTLTLDQRWLPLRQELPPVISHEVHSRSQKLLMDSVPLPHRNVVGVIPAAWRSMYTGLPTQARSTICNG